MTGQLDRPFDAGLQTERTALAWQRTILASTVGFLLAARLLMELVGIPGVLVAAAGLLVAVALFLVGHRRYRQVHTILVASAGDRVRLASAAPLAVWAVVVCALGLIGLISAIVLAMQT